RRRARGAAGSRRPRGHLSRRGGCDLGGVAGRERGVAGPGGWCGPRPGAGVDDPLRLHAGRSRSPDALRRDRRDAPAGAREGEAERADRGGDGARARRRPPLIPGIPTGTDGVEMEAERPADLVRTTLQLLFIGALIASSFWILRPFLTALIWATTIAVATWPILLHLQSWLLGRRGLAVAAMTLALLLTVVVPLYFAVATIVENTERIPEWTRSLTALSLPAPPSWVEGIPGFGWPQAGARWLTRVRRSCPPTSRPMRARSPAGSFSKSAASGGCSSSSCSR